ncbi:MAG: hypothetical protein WDN30_08180 [Pararobbsia sp.]
MATVIHWYRGFQIALDLFPKAGGKYAWAYSIGGGDAFGLERDRPPTRDEAIARAKAAAESRIDSLLARSALTVPTSCSIEAGRSTLTR